MTFSGSREDQVRELRSIADRVAQSHGLELFDLQFRRESIGWVLRIIIDRATPSSGDGSSESVSVSDCEVVSAGVGAILDAEVEFEHTFTLEVSSPGLDRPLRNLEDFVRFIGRRAKIITSEPVQGQTFVSGRIVAVHDRVIVIEDGATTRHIPEQTVARAQLEVEV